LDGRAPPCPTSLCSVGVVTLVVSYFLPLASRRPAAPRLASLAGRRPAVCRGERVVQPPQRPPATGPRPPAHLDGAAQPQREGEAHSSVQVERERGVLSRTACRAVCRAVYGSCSDFSSESRRERQDNYKAERQLLPRTRAHTHNSQSLGATAIREVRGCCASKVCLQLHITSFNRRLQARQCYGRRYTKAARGEFRAVPIGATASHASNAGSYRSTELRSSSCSLKPPTAYSLPSSTATP